VGSRGKAPGQGVRGEAPLKLKALFYFKGARMLFSGPISTKYTSVSRYTSSIIIVHLMTLKSEVAELRYEVAELSSVLLSSLATAYVWLFLVHLFYA